MSDEKRQYKMKRRAEQEAETRLRITEAAVTLHGTVGPAQTSVSAVAELAGVRRSTVYRHFPDEEALFGACSAHWAAANPPPDVTAWARIEDPGERLDAALAELYAYYRGTADMLERLFRDVEQVPVLAELMSAFWGFLEEAAEILLAGRGRRGRARQRTRAAIGHALAFTTWRDLTGTRRLDDAAAAGLMSGFVASA